jgi:hypothetical protein
MRNLRSNLSEQLRQLKRSEPTKGRRRPSNHFTSDRGLVLVGLPDQP